MSSGKKFYQGGYIALMSAIIISALLIVISVTLSFTGFFARFNILDAEFKNRSLGLAEACANAALLKLAEDSSFSGNQTVAVGTDSCMIFGVATSAGKFVFKTQGIYPATGAKRAYSNIALQASAADLSIVSWEETPN